MSTEPTIEMADVVRILKNALRRPVAYHRVFADLAGRVSAGLMLSQAYYWTPRTADEDGWFFKSREEWQEETGLSRSEQESARKRLVELGVLQEELRGMPGRLHFRIDMERLVALLAGIEPEPITLETLLKEQSTTLKQISKTAYMRAVKANIPAEKVDYAAVLQAKGLICGICNLPITRGVGQKAGYLSFDHIKAISDGGSHTFDNVQPAHTDCNLLKGGNAIQLATVKPTDSWFPQSPPAGFGKANKSATTKPPFLIDPETTPESTTKTTRSKSDAGTRIPEPFLLTAEMRAWAKKECPNINITKGTQEFVDYWRGRVGKEGKKADWEATWRNRMRVLQERAEQGSSRRPQATKGDSSVDAAKQAAADFRNGATT